MGDDLHLNDRRYYLCVVAFQIGYVIAEIPCNMILSRSRPSIFIPVIMVLWGSVCAIMACAQTWKQLVGLRFVLGIAEAGFSVSEELRITGSTCRL
jgi:MFS family permease